MDAGITLVHGQIVMRTGLHHLGPKHRPQTPGADARRHRRLGTLVETKGTFDNVVLKMPVAGFPMTWMVRYR